MDNGLGNDTCLFSTGDGNDVIFDHSGQDALGLGSGLAPEDSDIGELVVVANRGRRGPERKNMFRRRRTAASRPNIANPARLGQAKMKE